MQYIELCLRWVTHERCWLAWSHLVTAVTSQQARMQQQPHQDCSHVDEVQKHLTISHCTVATDQAALQNEAV